MTMEATQGPTSVTPRNRARSKALYDKACGLMPGGVNSPVRAFRSVGGTPIFYESACGSEFRDEDRNVYVDFCLSWGPLILGHAFGPVVEAVREAAVHGLSYGAPHRRELELAERILRGFPEFDRVRLTCSGTEAVMSACRLARAATKRPLLLKFDGCYHGHVDALLVRAGSGLATFSVSDSAGVPEELAALTISVPLDDVGALERAFAEHGSRIAGAIIEPMPANNGLLLQRRELLVRLRELCDANGSLLIFDEVISGFRLRFGGYMHEVGIRPDLVTLGKIVGGGMPVGAFLGPRHIMEMLAPLGPVYQAGTLAGNPVATAAGNACLAELESGRPYARLAELGAHLDGRIAALQVDFPWVRWVRQGSVFWLQLAGGAVARRPDEVPAAGKKRYALLHARLIDRGYYMAPSAFEVGFLSHVHTEAQLDGYVAAIRESLAGLDEIE